MYWWQIPLLMWLKMQNAMSRAVPKIFSFKKNCKFVHMTRLKTIGMRSLMILPLALIFSCFPGDRNTTESTHEAPAPKAEITYTDGDIDAAIKALENDKTMDGAQWSFSAYNFGKSKYVASRNKDLRLVPASVLKVFTTISAYDLLGHQSTFETHLYYRGKISTEGVLQGDLIIKGTGDPTIACDHFGQAAAALTVFASFRQSLNKAGIKSVQGSVIGDASLWGYMLQAPGYMWEDLGNYYGAGASSLNYNENKLKVTFKPGKTSGDSASLISITSHPFDPIWINSVTTAGANTGDNVYIYGTPLQKVRFLTGTVPAGKPEFVVWASDPDPALRFAYDFQEFLKKSGVSVSQACKSTYIASTDNDKDLQILHTHKSPTIKEISLWVNHRSHNVSAESVFRHIGMKKKSTSSYEETAKYLLSYWKSKGIATDNIIITDGSGLSRTNMITTGFLVDMLIFAQKQTWYNDLYDILPIAGKDGTLKTNFKGTSVENNMHGKSGLLKGVRSYTGYLHNRSGELIAFAVIANGHTLTNADIRKKLENLVVALSDSK